MYADDDDEGVNCPDCGAYLGMGPPGYCSCSRLPLVETCRAIRGDKRPCDQPAKTDGLCGYHRPKIPQKTINRWKIVSSGDAYTAPEKTRPVVTGIFSCSGHECDGMFITTSPIKYITRRTLTTESGSKYQLGDPDPEFLDWVEMSDCRTLDEMVKRYTKKRKKNKKPIAFVGG